MRRIEHNAVPTATGRAENLTDNERRHRAEVDRAFRAADLAIAEAERRLADLEARVAALESP